MPYFAFLTDMPGGVLERRTMPTYPRLRDLPVGVKAHLPKDAQEIYLEAYNSTWKQYDQPAEPIDDASREETSHRVAWTAVKRLYEKDEQTGDWHRIKN